MMELLTHNAGKVAGGVVFKNLRIAQLISHLHMDSKANLHNKANDNYWLSALFLCRIIQKKCAS
jgi:hypothetical protein